MPRPKGRKRKDPLTIEKASKPNISTGSSHKATQAIISSYHVLLKRRDQLRVKLESTAGPEQAAIRTLLVDLDSKVRQGHEEYQRASQLGQSGQRGGDTSKVLLDWLHELGYHDSNEGTSTSPSHLSMLEIGAVSPHNYRGQETWIQNEPIDLHSTHPDILQQDFFARPLPDSDEGRKDIVSCSLVLNFVASPAARGQMLHLMRQHLRPNPRSLLFLVLPSPCLTNSRYFDQQTLETLMRSIGFECVKDRNRPHGKLAFSLWQWAEADTSAPKESLQRKRVICEGPSRNNFAVVLPRDTRYDTKAHVVRMHVD